jgi:hypothetical protein
MGRLSFSRGRSFELRVAKWLRAAGFDAERVDESFRGYGYDIVASYKGKTLAVIQCKVSSMRSALDRGWKEVEPAKTPFRACVHSWRRPRKAPVIRAMWATQRDEAPQCGNLLHLIQRLTLASAALT